MAPVSPSDPRPPYAQIADELRVAITSGTIKPGEKLKSGRELAERYGVAPMTVHHAIRVLRDEGLVVSWQGRGVFVRDRAAIDAEADSPATFEAIMRRLDAMYEDMQRIDDRLNRLETERSSDTGPDREPQHGT